MKNGKFYSIERCLVRSISEYSILFRTRDPQQDFKSMIGLHSKVGILREFVPFVGT